MLEIEARHTQEGGRRVALLHEIASAWEDGCDDPAQAYDALARALAENPVDAETQQRIERLARVLGKHDDLLARYESIAASGLDEDVRRALYHKIAALAEAGPGGDERAAAAYVKALELGGRRPRRRPTPSSASTCAARTTPAWSTCCERKIGHGRERRGEEAARLQGGQGARGGARQPGEGHRRLPADPGGRRERRRPPSSSSSGSTSASSRWQDLKDIYARKADLAADPVAKKQMLFVLGQVYDRELRDPAKAIETYNAILDLDANDYEALQALDRLYAETERWFDLLSVLERETELAPIAGRGGVAALPHRRAVAREAEGSGPGGRGLPGRRSPWIPATSRPCGRSRA